MKTLKMLDPMVILLGLALGAISAMAYLAELISEMGGVPLAH